MTKHTYIVVRHGFSFANQSKTIVSDPANGVKPEYGLTDEGKAQAVKSAEVLRDEFTANANKSFVDSNGAPKSIYVVSSPFSRAVQTANIFLEVLGRDSEPSTPAPAPVSPLPEDKSNKGNSSNEKPGTSSGATSSAPVTNTKVDKKTESEALYPKSLRSRIMNKDLKTDVSFNLCERFFGAYELQSDTNYSKVWDEDLKSQHSNTKDVESLASVWARVSLMLNRFEQTISQPSVILLVSHGDTLQITQTAFSGKPLTTHRSLKHLTQAEYRVLPPITKSSALSAFKSSPVFSKL